MNRQKQHATLERELKRLRDLLAASKAAAEKNVGRRQRTAQREINQLETRVKKLDKEIISLEKRSEEAEGLFDAAKATAVKAGAKLGISFKAGTTTSQEIEKRVTPTEEQAALAVIPPLPFGIGYKSKFMTALGWILLLPCATLIFVEFGLIFGGIVFGGGGSLRLHTLPLAGALAVALLISIGVQSALRRIWREVGVSVALGRGRINDFPSPIIAAALIAILGATLDAYVVHQLAAVDSDTAISWWACVLIGFLISGIYALSAVGAAFMNGYHPTAVVRVKAHQKDVWEKALEDIKVSNAVQSFTASDKAQLDYEDSLKKLPVKESEIDRACEEIRSVYIPNDDAEDYTAQEKAQIQRIKDQIEIVETEIDALLAAMFEGGQEA